jgi:hypothetical protein
MFVLRTVVGSYYTGRAGAGWVSAFKSEAFTMGEGEAHRKAELFNRRANLTGFLWEVVAL